MDNNNKYNMKERDINHLIKASGSDTNLISDEIWKGIIGYETKYQVSSFGRIKSLSKKVGRPDYKDEFVNRRKDIILKSNVNSKGKSAYPKVNLGRNNTYLVHIIVGQHFIPNPNNYPCINHKDGNKLNNHVDNLEWCSYRENNQHAYKLGLNKPQVQNLKLRWVK